MEEKKMKAKTPPMYYGGKQTMARLVISLMPDHVLYAEPITGGQTLSFHKSPSVTEVEAGLRKLFESEGG